MKDSRYLGKVYGPIFQVQKLYEELYNKHFRKFYNSKPTERS
ncbi:hypothetical protein [Chitinophaga niastensis]|nr:hypothetical protein [Chitinophaga niastensis]